MLPHYPKQPVDDFSAGPNPDVLHPERVNMGQAPQELKPQESHELWKRVYARVALSPAASLSYRVALAWRLTREIAERSQLLTRETPLTEIDLEWTTVNTGKNPNHTDLPMEEWALAGLLHREPGIHLHPGAEPTLRFERVIALLTEELELDEGCTAVPDLGYYGLQDLVALWPTQEQILAHELKLIEAIHTNIEHKGQTRVADYITSITGLRRGPARKLARVAQWELREDTAMDPELRRSLLIQQIEHVVFRAQKDGNLTAELAGHRLLIQLSGLLKGNADDTLDKMQEYIAKMAAQDEEEDE